MKWKGTQTYPFHLHVISDNLWSIREGNKHMHPEDFSTEIQPRHSKSYPPLPNAFIWNDIKAHLAL